MKIRRIGSPGWTLLLLSLPVGIGIAVSLLLPLTQNPKLISATLHRERLLADENTVWDTIPIDDAVTLAKLESFFPGYRQRPAGFAPGGWMTGYEIDFNYSDATSVHVVVEAKPSVEVWSSGNGDHPIRGDFRAFADGL